MQKNLANKNISSETMGAIFIVIFVSLFILANLFHSFVWPLFILAMAISFALSVIYPRSGLFAIVFLTMVWERFFTLQTFWIGKVEYKLYPIDILLAGIILGIASQYFFGKIRRISLRKADYFLLAFIFWNFLYFAHSLFVSGGELSVAFSSLKNYGFYSLAYFIVLFLIRTPSDLRKFLESFLAGGAAIIILLLIGIARGEGLWSEYTPLTTSGSRILAASHAFFLSVVLIPLLGHMIFRKTRFDKIWNILAIAWIVGIAGSLMRNIWLGVFFAVCSLYLLIPEKNKVILKRKAWQTVFLTGILLVLIFYVSAMMPQSSIGRSLSNPFLVAFDRVQSIASEDDSSIKWRYAVWKEAFDEYKNSPILGLGLGQRVYVEMKEYEYKDFIELRNGHNSVLVIIFQLGLAGFVLFFLAIYRNMADLWRKAEKSWLEYSLIALAAYFLVVFQFQPYLEVNMTSIIFWMVLGIIRIMPYNRNIDYEQRDK